MKVNIIEAFKLNLEIVDIPIIEDLDITKSLMENFKKNYPNKKLFKKQKELSGLIVGEWIFDIVTLE